MEVYNTSVKIKKVRIGNELRDKASQQTLVGSGDY